MVAVLLLLLLQLLLVVMLLVVVEECMCVYFPFDFTGLRLIITCVFMFVVNLFRLEFSFYHCLRAEFVDKYYLNLALP